MKQVLVLGFGDPQRAASTIFRVTQYESMFREHGATLSYIAKPDIGFRSLRVIRRADVVINQKCLLGLGMRTLIRASAKRLVFDFDDAVWARPVRPYHPLKRWQIEQRLMRWANASDVATVANSYLAAHLRRLGGKPEVVPMSLDLKLWKPRADGAAQGQTVLMGWAGSPVSFPYLEAIAPALGEALRRNPNLKLAVYSGKRPKLGIPYEYVEFARGTEHEFIRRLDIGLLPLADDESARGKSPMKAIQYLACGVPVVGATPGATRDILSVENSLSVRTHEEWIDALGRLANNEGLRRSLGANGRACALAKFDRDQVGERFVQLVLGAPPG